MPLEAKKTITLSRIKEFYDAFDGDVYISFSGGKDSTVLAHMVRSMYPDVPLVFCNTGLEYPEIIEFVRKQSGVVWLKPNMTFKQVIEKHGFPITTKVQAHYIKQYRRNPKADNSIRILTGINPKTNVKGTFKLAEKWQPLLTAPFKVSNQCCDEMKKKPFHKYEKETKRKPFVGIVSGESVMRNKRYLENGCNIVDNDRPQSTPLAFWTEQDILQYIKQNDLEIAKVYGDVVELNDSLKTTGVTRTGCMFCGFGVHLDQTPNRFQQMKLSHPKLWDYCMFKIGMSEPLDFIGVNYGQQIDIEELIRLTSESVKNNIRKVK